MTSTIKVRNIEMGEGAASDSKILFDGNAQDFHIGLDDSADSLTIGLGSTLGTTSHMVFDANGIITKPLQPAFSVTNTGSAQSWNAGTTNQVTFDGERFDVNGDFGSNQFTAPVTGKYHLSCNMAFTNLDTGATSYFIDIFTSNRRYLQYIAMALYGGSDTSHGYGLSLLADMDADDVAKVQVGQNGGANQTSLNNDAEFLHFTGYLVC
jgi:hypothetical protein